MNNKEFLKKLNIDYLLVNSTNEFLVEYSDLEGEDPLIIISQIYELDYNSYVVWLRRAYQKNMEEIWQYEKKEIEIDRVKALLPLWSLF